MSTVTQSHADSGMEVSRPEGHEPAADLGVEELRARLAEAEDTLRAIRDGKVDALVVSEGGVERVYTLESADRPYRIMIEEMGQGAVTVAVDGTVLYCNRRFAALLQAPLESLLGATVQDWVAPAGRPVFETLLRQGQVQGSAQGEVQLRAGDGGLLPAYLAITALPGASDGEEPVLCLVVTDLTEQKAAAEAAAANRAKDHFLAMLSHELRTPLTPVLAVVSGLEGDPRLPGDVQGQIAMMRRNLELEARLIDDMLDLTRIARGKLDLRREVADLHQVLEHALQTIGVQLAGKRLQLVTDLRRDDLRLWADAPRLTQVFWNLLHNAVKFTPPDGAIRLCSRREPGAGGDWAVVEVADTGIGIDAEALEQIFDAFDQGRPGTARRFGGLGLGLAISKVIVELHGGVLSAASAGKERGATFQVRLPLREIPAAARVEAPAPHRQEPARPGAVHILLVEDHADTAEALADLLGGLGYRVTTAGSVAAGLAAAAETQDRPGGRIDLVVSDLGLPDGSGLDLMRELSRRYGLRGISLSGYGMEEDVRSSREAGFERHVTKPTSIQSLQDALHQLLESAS